MRSGSTSTFFQLRFATGATGAEDGLVPDVEGTARVMATERRID